MIGILLAAGHSRRFGMHNKLQLPIADGKPMALVAAQNLLQAIPVCLAIIRPDQPVLQTALRAIGIEVMVCDEQIQQMADSLAAAIRHTRGMTDAETGFVIALADMPFIKPETIQRVAHEISSGGDIAAPTFRNQRGHPVGFSARYRDELESLQGDAGARSLLQKHARRISLLPCDDPGILIDIDTEADARNWISSPSRSGDAG